MVKVKSQDMIFDNGALDMAMNLLHIQRGSWSNTPKEAMYLDFRATKYKEKSWEIEGFENDECFVERNWKTNEVEGPAHDLGRFPMEKLIKWDEDNFIKYPLIKVNSIKFYPDTFTTKWDKEPQDCLTIEIESDNDEAVIEIFTLLAGLANGGHCCGGHIRVNEQQMKDGGHVANFGLDGDGCDRIYYVNDEYLD